MEIDTKAELRDPKGKAFSKGEDGEPATLGDILYLAVTNSKGATQGSPDEKRARGRVAALLCADGAVEVSPEQHQILLQDCAEVLPAHTLWAVDQALGYK